jgi:hypothetical protein
MKKLSLLVAASVIGLGSSYAAMAQTPVSKPGAKATIQAPALLSAKSNLGSFARVAPAAKGQSIQTSLGAMAKVAFAQAVASATGSKMSALAASPAAATGARAGVGNLVNASLVSASMGKANLSAAVNTSARTSSAASANIGLNPTASAVSVAVTKTNGNLGAMARVTSGSQVSAVTRRLDLSALARAVPSAGLVNKSNFNAYAK